MGPPRVMVATGCASGIGRHLASALAAAGHHLVATDVDLPALEEQARRAAWPPSQVLVRKLDVRDPAAWEQVLDLATTTWGHLDVVFNVAGVLRCGYLHLAPAEEVDLQLDVNSCGRRG